ncbi:MAG: hypothetical protein KC776_16385 [Myxococcales bacterium]|nr:hypothetical protein [Myxococcales bacterium]MCB9578697.1 hypothetical protein [Polyangiaceae bacterium]
MHRQEADLERCISCGAELDVSTGRPFVFGEELLCYDCAIARGGAYDHTHETWTKAPDLAGLYDSRRPHA